MPVFPVLRAEELSSPSGVEKQREPFVSLERSVSISKRTVFPRDLWSHGNFHLGLGQR